MDFRTPVSILFAVVLATACAGRAATIEDGPSPDASSPGSDGAADAAADGGRRGSPCSGPPVTFELTAPSAGAYCVGAGCEDTWLTILREDRSVVTTSMPCTADCDPCVPIACTAACPPPYPMPADGVKRTWNGTYYIDDRCGAERTQCALARCAPPGNYIARMCVHRASPDAGTSGVCVGSSTPTCTEVSFQWPATSTIKGFLN